VRGVVRETLHELWGELRAQKVRSLLSLLGIGWGTLALVLLLAFSFGFEALFVERSRGLGDAVAIGWPQRTTIAANGFPAGRPVRVHHADVAAVAAQVPTLAAISSEYALVERVRLGAAVHRVPISGVDPAFARLRSLPARPGGRFPNERDAALRARVVFLGDVLARTLFPAQDPVGRTLLLRGMPFLVVGVLQPKLQDSDYGGQDKDRAWLPATTFLQVFGERPVSNLVFRAEDSDHQERCTEQLVAALAQRLHFDPRDRAALTVWDTTEQRRMLGYIFLGFHTMLGIGGAFTLLVGGLGIAHLMHLMVRRRTAEIGLKLAIGATPARLRGEWLLQALAVVAGGAGGGLLLALLVIALVRASPATAMVGVPFVPTPLWLATALLLAAIAFVAGWLPARAAARLDPVQALRGGP
jgi:putative ABC transport system permease protein